MAYYVRNSAIIILYDEMNACFYQDFNEVRKLRFNSRFCVESRYDIMN